MSWLTNTVLTGGIGDSLHRWRSSWFLGYLSISMHVEKDTIPWEQREGVTDAA